MKFPILSKNDECFTPPNAVDVIVPFLPKDKIYWEACYGEGYLAKRLMEHGFTVVGEQYMDCLKEQPDNWDVWITNPPFSNNKTFVKRAIFLGKPFAFLMRLEHLGGVGAHEVFSKLDIQIIIPKRRIHYINKTKNGYQKGNSPFHSIWITWGLGLPKEINYERI